MADDSEATDSNPNSTDDGPVAQPPTHPSDPLSAATLASMLSAGVDFSAGAPSNGGSGPGVVGVGLDGPTFGPGDFVELQAAQVIDYGALWRRAFSDARDAHAKRVGVSAAIALLSRADPVVMVVAAWQTICPPFDAPEMVPPESQDDCLARAWLIRWQPARQAEDPLIMHVAASTGLTYHQASAAFRVAVANRLVYPDGEISAGAAAFLRSEAAGELARHRPPVGKVPALPK